RAVPDSHRHAPLRAHAGRDDARGVDAAVPPGPNAAVDGEAAGEGDREADLSRQLLSEQGAPREGVLPDAPRSLRRAGAVDAGGAGDAAGRRPEDREPGDDSRL